MVFVAYANTGPFTNNVTPPGISATFLGNVESFLDQIVAPLVADSHVSADGLGNVTTLSATLTSTGTGLTVQHNATVSGRITCSGINFPTGSVTRMNVFTGSASSSGTLQAHGLGATPDFCIFQQTVSGGADTNDFQWDKNASDSTNVKVWSPNATSRNYIALAIKL